MVSDCAGIFSKLSFQTVILSETGSALSVLPMESKNPCLPQ
jgi:hypothetical protein